jgi:DegV family protein with EDD domain
MSTTGIVTDSTNCLPQNVIEEYGIKVIPVGLTLDGNDYWDIELSNDDFWTLFKKAKSLPTTNAASPGSFVKVFEDLAQNTDSIVCILVSKALSATNEVAVQAIKIIKDKYPALNIEIVDSKTSSGALGFIVLEAARAARSGKSLQEIVQVAEEMIPRVKFVTAMHTLKYLIKTGRAPKTAYLGEVFQTKPLIGMVSNSGLVDSLGRVNGKKKAAVKLVELMEDYIDITKPVHIMVHYTDNIRDAEELKDMVISRVNCIELYITPYSPVMASAVGPVIALSFYT